MKITYNIYVDNEFVTDFIFENPSSLMEVFESDNPKFLDITDFDQIPSYGMIFKNNQFEDGPNGETFFAPMKEMIEDLENQYSSLEVPRVSSPNIKAVAFFDNDIFKQNIFFDLGIGDVEKTYAALMSNPTIEKVVE